MIYLDASAAITLFAHRRPAPELRAFLAGHPGRPLATSTVGFVEIARGLDRIGSFPDVRDILLRQFTEVLLTEEVRDAAFRVPPGLRTLDALHVASAQAIGAALTMLVTYDQRMYKVARSLGLPVAAPGVN